MKQLDIASMILNDILDNHTRFPDALKKVFQSSVELRPLRGDVAGLIGCELRHDLLFAELLKGIDGLDEKDKRIVSLGLANVYFYRHFSLEEISNAVKGRLGEEKYNLVSSLFVEKEPGTDLVPDSVDKKSLTYLSLRYNIPEWALKIFHHFNYSICFKSAKRYARPFVTTLRLKDESLYEGYKASIDFAETKIPYIFAYKGKTPLRKIEDLKNGKLFEERPGAKDIIDQTLISAPCEALLYTGSQKTGFEKELIQTYKNTIGLNIGTKDLDAKVDVVRELKQSGLKNVNLYEAKDPLSMDAAISSQQDLVICCPDSTNFDAISVSPDFFIQFDRDRMDEIMQGEKDALEGCSKFVEVGGKLVYCVFTLSVKEGRGTVTSFLKNHPEFELIKDKQHFPFEEAGCTYYYAIMERKEDELTLSTPISSLQQTSLASSSSVSFGK